MSKKYIYIFYIMSDGQSDYNSTLNRMAGLDELT